MVIRHGEAFSISDRLTVRDEDGTPVYRPTVHYAYCPADAAIASLHELHMRRYELQDRRRIGTDDIVEGRDELGCLLMGHPFKSWWIGSLLDIHESRRLVPHQNATTLQVAASILAAVKWMMDDPNEGVRLPDDLPHSSILDVAKPYLGPFLSTPVDWTPLDRWVDPFAGYGRPRPPQEDVWQFTTVLV
jgi:homospermidine synthase